VQSTNCIRFFKRSFIAPLTNILTFNLLCKWWQSNFENLLFDNEAWIRNKTSSTVTNLVLVSSNVCFFAWFFNDSSIQSLRFPWLRLSSTKRGSRKPTVLRCKVQTSTNSRPHLKFDYVNLLIGSSNEIILKLSSTTSSTNGHRSVSWQCSYICISKSSYSS